MKLDNRIGTKTYTLSRADLERYLIETFNEPEDIVVTKISTPINQEAWLIVLQSSKYNKHGDLDTLSTARNNILSCIKLPLKVLKGRKYV